VLRSDGRPVSVPVGGIATTTESRERRNRTWPDPLSCKPRRRRRLCGCTRAGARVTIGALSQPASCNALRAGGFPSIPLEASPQPWRRRGSDAQHMRDDTRRARGAGRLIDFPPQRDGGRALDYSLGVTRGKRKRGENVEGEEERDEMGVGLPFSYSTSRVRPSVAATYVFFVFFTEPSSYRRITSVN